MEYQDYSKMIQKQAWKWHTRSHTELDDAVGECNLLFAECFPLHDSKKGQFSTLLFSSVENRFKNIITKNNQNKNKHISCEFIEETNSTDGGNQEKRCIFKDSLNKMTNEAKDIVAIIFDAPKDLINMIPKSKLSVYQLSKYLVKIGWKKKIIDKTLNEIKFTINS